MKRNFFFFIIVIFFSSSCADDKNLNEKIGDSFIKQIFSLFGETSSFPCITEDKEISSLDPNHIVKLKYADTTQFHGTYDCNLNMFISLRKEVSSPIKSGNLKNESDVEKKAFHFLEKISPEFKNEFFLKQISLDEKQWNVLYERQYKNYKFRKDGAIISLDEEGNLLSYYISKSSKNPTIDIKVDKSEAQINAIKAIENIFLPFYNWKKCPVKPLIYDFIGNVGLQIDDNNSAEYLGLFIVNPNKFLKDFYHHSNNIYTFDSKLVYEFSVIIKYKNDFWGILYNNIPLQNKSKINVWIDSETGAVVGGLGPLWELNQKDFYSFE